MVSPVDRPLWALAHALGAVARPLVFRQKNRYLGAVPETGPLLLLGNHAAFLDPVVLALGVSRPVHFMATEYLFRQPRVGPLIRRLGAFPKAKFARDTASLDQAIALHAAGRVVGIFPEGDRSWDGRPLPMLPGLGWLIKKLGGTVVFVRNLSGWMMQPRWARYPRSVPMELEFSAPFVFPEEWSATRVEEEVAARLSIDPAGLQPAGWTFGRRMAHGLPEYLWACPACFRLDGLVVVPEDGNAVCCQGCGAGWRLDVQQKLTPLPDAPGAAPLTVARAFDCIAAHFGELPTVDADRFVAEGIALEDPRVAVFRVAEPLVGVADGPAVLLSDRLRVGAGDGAWELPLEEIKAVSMEAGHALELRTNTDLYQFKCDIPHRWYHFLRGHVGRSRPVRRGRKR